MLLQDHGAKVQKHSADRTGLHSAKRECAGKTQEHQYNITGQANIECSTSLNECITMTSSRVQKCKSEVDSNKYLMVKT